MILTPADSALFYKLWPSLLFFLNQESKTYPDLKNVDELMELSIESKSTLHNALFKDISVIDRFVAKNPYKFSADELQIYGIITQLSNQKEPEEQSDEAQLKFYFKSQANREMYEDEINDLIAKDRSLLVVYHQEMSKIHARKYKSRLQELGLDKGFFVVLNDVIVASGETEAEVEDVIQTLVPSSKRDWVHIFQIKAFSKKKIS